MRAALAISTEHPTEQSAAHAVRPLTHLEVLEADSIQIMREVVAEFARPVMLYSIGKDSSVMLRLAQKAFYPGPIPFPLLHVDTTYKFREMITFRDRTAVDLGAHLIVHTNLNAIASSFLWVQRPNMLSRSVRNESAQKTAGDDVETGAM